MSIAETKTTVVNIELSEEDCQWLRQLAAWKWPGVDMSDAQILMSLARMAGGCLMKKKNEEAK